MDDSFYRVAIPEPTTILGLRLRPLALGHLIILHRLRSAFVTQGEPITLHDLALSILVCSLPYRDGLELFNGDLSKFFKEWHDKLTGASFFTRCGLRKPRKVDYPEKVKAFADYLEAGSSSPYFSYDTAKAKSVKCPEVQVVKVALMRELHIPEAELMDRPWAMCLWDFVTIRALSGNVEFQDRDAIHAAQAAADAFAERLKAKGGLNGGS